MKTSSPPEVTAKKPMPKAPQRAKKPAAVLLCPLRQKPAPAVTARRPPPITDPPELQKHPVLRALPGARPPAPKKSPFPLKIFSFRTQEMSLRTVHLTMPTPANTLLPGKSLRAILYIFGYTESPIRKMTIYLLTISGIYVWCITILTGRSRSGR